MDADERLEAESKSEIKKLIKKTNKIGVKCLVKSIDSFRKNSQMMKYTRLFKNNNDIRFSGKAHEQIEPSLLKNNYQIIDSNITILHYGYDVSDIELKEKAKRNLTLLLNDYSDHKYSYSAYQIANSYSIIGDTKKAVEYFSLSIKDNKLRKELRSICYLHLADYEMRNKNLEKAKEYIQIGLKEYTRNSLLFLLGSQVYGSLNDFDTALKYCKNAFKINEQVKANKLESSSQEILVDEKKIIYQGLLVSILANNNEGYNYFILLLNKYKNREETIIR